MVSKPGAGSIFSFSLKIKKGVVPDLLIKKAADNKIAHPFADVKILLVEDNLINQKVASYTLTKQGALVEIANHGKEAIIMLEQKSTI